MRRLLGPLLASLVLAAPAGAQVGDEQYSDPLAQPGQTQSEGIPGVAQDQEPTLSDEPVGGAESDGAGDTGSTGAGSGTAGSGSSGSSDGPTASARELPNTGADARVLAGLGLAFLLLGIGLRLRTADERF